MTTKRSSSNISLSLLKPKHADYVSDNITSQAFYETCLGTAYCLPQKSVRQAVCLNYHRIILNTFAQKTNHQYVLSTNDDDAKSLKETFQSFVGSIQVYTPEFILDKKKKFEDEMYTPYIKYILLWLLKNPSVGPSMIYRSLRLIIAMKIIVHNFKQCYPRYYQIEYVAIKPSEQSKGFGSKMLSLAHNEIIKKTQNMKQNKDIPIFLDSPTPRAVRFYVKNGYKIFCEVVISKKVSMFGLVYHPNEDRLNEMMEKLNNNVQYVIEFSVVNKFWKLFKKSNIREKILALVAWCIFGPLFVAYLWISTLLRCVRCRKILGD